MNKLRARLDIKAEAKKRMKSMVFGDRVTNICAGDRNPMLHCYFVKNRKDTAQCTDKKGHFWDIDIKVIYPGHLDEDVRRELFEPVWQSEHSE